MKKSISILASLFVLMLIFPMTIFAQETSKDIDNNLYHIEAKITNNITGESLSVPIEHSIKRSTSSSDSTSFSDEAEVTFKLPFSSTIRPFSSDTSIAETDVKATITISYDHVNEQIRVNKVSGSWRPSSSYIYLNNREVHYGDGVPFGGHSAHKYPTSNTFSYTTGWGWVLWYPASQDGMSGARAFSSATVFASGMTPHTIEVFVTATQ